MCIKLIKGISITFGGALAGSARYVLNRGSNKIYYTAQNQVCQELIYVSIRGYRNIVPFLV